MSVVKKYQPGGQITPSLEDYMANALQGERFNKNGLLYARNAASLFAKLGKQPNFNEIFEFDPINGMYTIHVDKIQDSDLKKLDWSGSTKHGRPNIFGTNTGRDIRGEEGSGESKYMGWAAANLYNYMKQYKGTANSAVAGVTNATPKGLTYNPLNFDDAMIAMRAPGNKELSFESFLSTDKTNEARQKLLMEISEEYLQDYYNQSLKETEKGNTYNNMDKVQKALAAAKSRNFEEFRKASLGLNWDINSYILSPEKVQEQQKQNEIVAAQNKALDFEKTVRGTLSPEVVNMLVGAGYTNLVSGTPKFLSGTTQSLPEIQKWMAENQIRTVANDYGDERLISPIFQGGVLQGILPFNKLSSSLYGSYFGPNKFGKLAYFDKNSEEYDSSLFPQYSGTGEEWRTIKGKVNLPGNWNIYGIPKVTDNGFDFTSTLILDSGKGAMKVTGNPLTGYKNNKGEDVKVTLDDFGEDYTPHYLGAAKNIDKDIFNFVGDRQVADYSVLANEFNELTQREISRVDAEKWKSLIGGLRYIIKNGDHLDKIEAAEAYEKLLQNPELTKIVKPESNTGGAVRNVLEELDILKTEEEKKRDAELKRRYEDSRIKRQQGGSWRKKGGTLKMQTGGNLRKVNLMSEDQYLKMLREEPTEPTLKLKSRLGTLKDMSGLEKAGLGAAAFSILPGVGALGGGAVTAIDLMRMVQGEDVGWGTIAADLGFTGLSLIGLGGVGAATRAGKAALSAERLARLAKEAQAVKEATSIGKMTKSAAGTVEKLSKMTSKTKNLKELDIAAEELKALRESKLIGKTTTLSSPLNKVTKEKIIKELVEFKKSAQLPNQVIEKGLSEVSPKLAKAVKVGKIALSFAAATPLALSVPKVASQVAEGGIGNIQQEDLKNTLFLGAGITGFAKNRQLAKNIKKLVGKKPTKAITSIKNKEYDVDVTPETEEKIGKVEKVFRKGKAEERIKQKNLEKLNRFKDNFKKAYKAKTGQDAPEELLNDIELSDIKYASASQADSGILTKEELPSMTSKNYKKARKAIERSGIAGYGKPSWNYKEGGILKYQNPAGPITKGVRKKPMSPEYADYVSTLNPFWQALAQSNTRPGRANNPAQFERRADRYYSNGLFRGDPLKQAIKEKSREADGMTGGQRFLNSFGIVPKQKTVTPIVSLPAEDPKLKLEPWMTNNNLWKKPTQVTSIPSVAPMTPDQTSLPWIPVTPPIDEVTVNSPISMPAATNYNTIPIVPINKPVTNTVTNTGNANNIRTNKGADYNKRDKATKDEEKKWFNPSDITRFAQLASSNYFNNRATRAYLDSIRASYSPDLLAQRFLLKTPSLFNPQVEKEAANYTQMGRRMAGATTDLDKGMGARFEAERGATDIRLKGALERQQAINELTGKQQEMDYQVADTNRKIIDSNKAKYADMVSKIHQTLGLRTATQGNIMENFLNATGTSKANEWLKKEQAEGAEKYFELYKNPEYKTAIDNFNTNYSGAALAQKKKAFLDLQAKSGNKTNSEPYETTQEYIDFIKQRDIEQARLKQWEQNLGTAGIGFKMGLDPKIWGNIQYKSGGTLGEKIVLENEKSNNRLVLERFKQQNKIMLERTKQAYKSILENNKLMAHVLLRAFK